MRKFIYCALSVLLAFVVCDLVAVGLAYSVNIAVNLPTVVWTSFIYLLAILASGLTLAWLRLLPQFSGRRYKLYGSRFFFAGALAGAFVPAFWVALLDFSAGGLTNSFAHNLENVMPDFFAWLGSALAFVSFLVFAITFGFRPGQGPPRVF